MADAVDKKEEVADAPSGAEVKLPDPRKLVVSASPHAHGGGGVKRIMWTVVAALMPACAAGIYYFGLPALEVLVICVVSCVGLEALFCRFTGNPQAWKDGSAVITGLLLAMNLSAGVPWWLCLVGALLAIGLGKHIFGGLGHNPFNPALVARVGLLLGFPALMTTWVPPKDMSYMMNDQAGFFAPSTLKELRAKGIREVPFSGDLDGITCATPLGIVSLKTEKARTEGGKGKAKGAANPFVAIANPGAYKNYFFGNVGGCLGETSALFILLGGLILFAFGIIRWQVPFAFLGTVALFTFIAHSANPSLTPGPEFHLLTGGVLLGAFFIATDMVTSPMTGLGGFIFGVGCGVVTCSIRIWGNYPEGVSFAILFMNALVPLIDRWTVGKPFGYRPPVEAAPAKC